MLNYGIIAMAAAITVFLCRPSGFLARTEYYRSVCGAVCLHPYWSTGFSLAVVLLIQLLANAPGKAEDASNSGI